MNEDNIDELAKKNYKSDLEYENDEYYIENDNYSEEEIDTNTNNDEQPTEEVHTKNLNEKITKRAEMNIKKKVVIIFVVSLLLLMSFAFIRSGINQQNSYNSEIIENEENAEENTGELEPINNMLSYQELAKEEKLRKELLKEQGLEEINYNDMPKEVTEEKITTKQEYTREEILGQNPLLEEYYTQKVQEELDSRNSDITFVTLNEEENNKRIKKENIDDVIDEMKKNLLEKYNVDSKETSNKKGISEYNSQSIKKALFEYEIKAGNIIPCLFLTGVNSQIDGQMIGTVREDVYDTVSGRHLLIPKGTRVIGTYDSGVKYGQDRLLIIWQRLIFPNGDSIVLDNFPGVDMSGYAGNRGEVNNHSLEMLKAVTLSSILSGVKFFAGGAEKDAVKTISEALGQGAGKQAYSVGEAMMSRALSIKPTIEIDAGTRFNIIVNADLVLRPYLR